MLVFCMVVGLFADKNEISTFISGIDDGAKLGDLAGAVTAKVCVVAAEEIFSSAAIYSSECLLFAVHIFPTFGRSIRRICTSG